MEDGIGLFFLSFLDCNSTSVQWKLCLNEGMFFYKAKHKTSQKYVKGINC